MASDLREVLRQEVPDVTFEDAIIQHFASALDNTDDEEVVEAWAHFMTDNGAAADDTSARELCRRILRRVRGPAEVIVEWMKTLKIDKPEYQAKAAAWCKEKNIRDVEGILPEWESFCSRLDLRRLEKDRVHKAVKKAVPDSPSPTPSEDMVARLRGKPTFGNPPYSLMEKLGSGVTADVHKCFRIEDGALKSYAVKVINLRVYRMLPNCDELIDKLKREISILFSLKHDNVVRLFDVVDDTASKNKLYLVMELVGGGDLFNYICEHGCQTEESATRIFLQLVYALKYVHSRGVIHRDLKPENILVERVPNSSPRVKITDFGHSKLANDGYSVALTKVGTPQYWAPEVLDDKLRAKGINEKVDLWSLGVVLFVMLTGSYPFEGDDKEMAENVRKGNFFFKPGRTPSDEAQDLIRKLIQPDPVTRLTLDECLANSWVQRHSGSALSSSLGSSMESHEDEESITLPEDPKDVKAFRSALSKFTTKCRFSATLRGRQQLVVIWQTAGLSGDALRTSIISARAELAILLQQYFPNFKLPPRDGIPEPEPGALNGGYPTLAQNSTMPSRGVRVSVGAPLAPVLEEKAPKKAGVRHTKVKLRVGTEGEGAGLDLVEEHGGMRVVRVHASPGQPGLEAGDLIVEISGECLGQTPDEVVQQFRRHFRDGAWMKIARGSE